MKFLLGSLACCVLVSGAGAQWSPAPPSNVTVVYVAAPEPQPSVVIMRERPATEPAFAPARQITYLIASKDNLVRQAAQYWVNGSTLYYVTVNHQEKSMPLDTIDRALSQRLNTEQNVTFSLPSGPEKSMAATRQIHSTTTSAHQQCCCATTPLRGKASRAARESGR